VLLVCDQVVCYCFREVCYLCVIGLCAIGVWWGSVLLVCDQVVCYWCVVG
jgi:hypothetical protein